jgi:hypothetical protein
MLGSVRIPAALRRLRSTILLLALTSGVTLGESGRTACEMHGIGAITSRAGGIPTGAHSAVDVAATPAGHHELAGEVPDGDCHCSCIGDCSVTAPAAIAPTSITVRVAIDRPQPRHTFDARTQQPAFDEPERLLPFAIGPPLA